jgi:hypothetical protein
MLYFGLSAMVNGWLPIRGTSPHIFKCNVVTSDESCHIAWAMAAWSTMLRSGRWDNLGMGLAGLCLVHCLGTAIILALLSSAGGLLLSPVIHEVGLVLAIIFGSLALIQGVLRHGFMLPAAIGGLGIGTMAGAAALPHGGGEIVLTVVGVAILALGHSLNQRASG